MEQPAISSDLIRGHIDTIILHSLIDGDKFPQQISDFIDAKSENNYQINQATLYSSLKRLESLNQVSSYWNDSENGRRKFYKITEKGKETVETNLSSWSYSRSILDKMMDCEQATVVKTEYVVKEVIVEKPVEVIVEKPVAVPTPAVLDTREILFGNNNASLAESKPQTAEIKPLEQTTPPQSQNNESNYVVYKPDEQDINFRNILGGLIKVNQTTKPQVEQLKPIEKPSENQVLEVRKPSFNETITNEEYMPDRLKFSGKIDFSDLVAKAKKDGYILRVSSNEPINTGKIYTNKLNLFTVLFVYIIAMLELVFISVKLGNVAGISLTASLITGGILTAIPLTFLIICAKNPKKAKTQASGDGLLVSAIVAFNLLIITFAANLISDVDFANLAVITFSVIIPIMALIDGFIFFLVKHFLTKLKCLRVK